MLVILPIALYILGSLGSMVLHWWKPRFRYGWLISIITALLVVGVTGFWGLRLPLMTKLTSWGVPGFEPLAISLLVDDISWIYSLSLAVLVLAALVTDTVYHDPSSSLTREWSDWPIAIGVAGLAFIPLVAENTFTLLAGWALLDIVEFILRLRRADNLEIHEQSRFFIASRLASLILVIAAGVFLRTESANNAMQDTPATANMLLIAAGGLRVFSIPGILPSMTSSFRRPLDVLPILTASSSSLMLISRLAYVGIPQRFATLVYLSIALLAVLNGLAWLTGRAKSSAAHLLLGGTVCFAIAAAAGSNSNAALAWGIAALLISGLAYLYIAKTRWTYAVIFLGWIAITSLPLTPTWAGVGAYATGLTGAASISVVGLLLIAQAVLLVAVLVSLQQSRPTAMVQERWAGISYPVVLLLIPALQWLFFAQNFTTLVQDRSWSELLILSWPSFTATGLSVFLLGLYRRLEKYEFKIAASLQDFLSYGWLREIFRRLHLAIKDLIIFIDNLSDGQGGILWTILLLLLIFALLIQLRAGS